MHARRHRPESVGPRCVVAVGCVALLAGCDCLASSSYATGTIDTEECPMVDLQVRLCADQSAEDCVSGVLQIRNDGGPVGFEVSNDAGPGGLDNCAERPVLFVAAANCATQTFVLTTVEETLAIDLECSCEPDFAPCFDVTICRSGICSERNDGRCVPSCEPGCAEGTACVDDAYGITEAFCWPTCSQAADGTWDPSGCASFLGERWFTCSASENDRAFCNESS